MNFISEALMPLIVMVLPVILVFLVLQKAQRLGSIVVMVLAIGYTTAATLI